MTDGSAEQRTNGRPLSRRTMIAGLAAAMGGLVASCHLGLPGPRLVSRPGPPGHAPAHGFRRRHHSGVYLTFDAPLGVYVVTGWPGYYWWDGHFYRHHDGVWVRGTRLKGRWRRAGPRGLPGGLRRGRIAGPHRARPRHRVAREERRHEGTVRVRRRHKAVEGGRGRKPGPSPDRHGPRKRRKGGRGRFDRP